MDLATLIIKTQDAKAPEEKDQLREQYNTEVRKKNQEFLDNFFSKIA